MLLSLIVIYLLPKTLRVIIMHEEEEKWSIIRHDSKVQNVIWIKDSHNMIREHSKNYDSRDMQNKVRKRIIVRSVTALFCFCSF